jgi:ferredoxin
MVLKRPPSSSYYGVFDSGRSGWYRTVGPQARRKEMKMAYKISDACTACGKCKESCPSEAIKEGEKKYSIDPEACIDCGVCVEGCEAKAISEA